MSLWPESTSWLFPTAPAVDSALMVTPAIFSVRILEIPAPATAQLPPKLAVAKESSFSAAEARSAPDTNKNQPANAATMNLLMDAPPIFRGAACPDVRTNQ